MEGQATEKCLYVGNLPRDITEERLRAFVEKDERQVAKITIVMDRKTGRPRGFAFVELENAEAAQSALEALNGSELEGHALRVGPATNVPVQERRSRGGLREAYDVSPNRHRRRRRR